MEDYYSKHYITVDDRGRITDGFSDAFRQPSEYDICINEKGRYQFRLGSGRVENPSLRDRHGVPLYKYEAGEIIRRTMEEIAEDIAAIQKPEEAPSRLDQIEAQATYTAMMTDTLLEEV